MTLEQLAEDMERTAFEKFITAPPFEYSIERMTHLSAWPGNYRVVAVQLAWEGWKARATYQRPCRGVAHPGCDYLAHVGLFAISVGNKFERTEMTLQERLRDYINDTHDCRLRKEAADRIDELEKELSEAISRIPARHAETKVKQANQIAPANLPFWGIVETDDEWAARAGVNIEEVNR